MSKLIAEEIVEAITLGDKKGFMSAFHSALAAKVSDALEIKKVEIASTLIAPASSEVVEEEVEQIDELAPKTYWDVAKARKNQAAAMNTMGTGDGDKLDQRANTLANAANTRASDRRYNAVQDAKKRILSPATRRSSGISTKHIFTKANGETVNDSMKKEEVERIYEAAKPDAKELKVSFGRGHSGQPGGEGQSDTVTTHHDNGLKVKSSIGWDGDHSIDVHHNGKHVGGIFSTHGSDSPRFEKNKKYTGEIEHKEVRTAMAAHQKHPEVQSWLIHNHSDSESEADTGTINGHKLHPTAERYLEKVTNDNDRDYEAPYRPQTKSAAKPTSASKASTSGAYERALAALQKRHGIKEEVEQVDEATPEAKGQSRAEWRMSTPDVIAKNNAKIADRKARAKKKLLSMNIPAGKGK